MPAHHLEGDSRDVVKLVLGLTATLTALVLGLLISSSYSAYQMQQSEVQQLGARLLRLIALWLNLGQRPMHSECTFGK